MIWNRRGDWYGVEYTVGDDPVMHYDKFQLKDVAEGQIEGQIIALLAKKHKCDHSLVRPYGAIVRTVG